MKEEKKLDSKAAPMSEVKKDEKIIIKGKKPRINPGIFILAISFLIGIFTAFYSSKILYGIIAFVGSFVAIVIYNFFMLKLKESSKIKKMEEVFPDFIELMASNLRAGMTIDRALLVSSRKEFAPLDVEILKLGKDILTGKEITMALKEMGGRIKSEKIKKTIELINSGMKAGGNLSVLLEETAVNMREKMFIEKKASSSVLMYVIFIFFASSVGGPTLFALSTVLVDVMKKIISGAPSQGIESVSANIPFALTKISISSEFIMVYAIVFIIVSNILASLMLGIANKGEEREGLKFVPIMIGISILAFLLIRVVMSGFIGNANFG